MRRAGLWVIALLAAMPVVPAAAAVPREGNKFSPRNGAELEEALATIAAEASPWELKTVQLADTTYEVASTLVIDNVTAPAHLQRPAEGTATITDTGTPHTLLKIRGEDDAINRSLSPDFDPWLRLQPSGAATAAFPLVHLESGGQAIGLDVRVPATTPNVTAVQLGAFPAVLVDSIVSTAATGAPALRMTSGSELDGSIVAGGAPTVSIGQDGPKLQSDVALIRGSELYGTDRSSGPVVQATAAGVPLQATLVSTIVAGDTTAPLVSLPGSTIRSGRLRALLQNVTLSGPESSAGVQVSRGVANAAAQVVIRASLFLDAERAVHCVDQGAITLADSFREGAIDAAQACSVAETGRLTGELRLRDRESGDLRPRWNSALVDASPVPEHGDDQMAFVANPWLNYDASGLYRQSRGPGIDYYTGTALDAGALEYQWTAPKIALYEWVPVGNRGLVWLVAQGSDENEDEEAGLTFRWTFPDGTTATGPDAEYRFPSTQRGGHGIQLTVRDPSGLSVEASRWVTPWWAPSEPATDDPSYEPPEPVYGPWPEFDEEDERPLPSTPAAPSAPGPVTPRPTTPARPTPWRPAVKRPPTLLSLELDRKLISRSARRPSGPGATKQIEGKLRIELTRDAQVAVTAASLAKGVATPVPGASISFPAKKGFRTVRLTTRFGTARLKRGLLRLTITAPGPDGQTEQQTVVVRVR